jgi:predicted phage gp36 major capsid-like protein
MEQEEAEKALDKSKEWRERQMTEVVEKHDAEVRELLEQIKFLERNSSRN